MGRAAARLDARDPGRSAQQAEQNALARLALILEALEPETPGTQAGGPGESGTAGQGNQDVPKAVQTVAELKLLKLLQQQINLRTRQLQQATAPGRPLDEAQQEEFRALGQEQGRLADLLLQMLKPAPQNPEDAHPQENSP
jgi:hypothetical protein